MRTRLFFLFVSIISCLSLSSCEQKDSAGRTSLNKYLTYEYDSETDGYVVNYKGERAQHMFKTFRVDIPEQYKGSQGVKPITKIANGAFKGVRNLSYVTMPDSIVEIGDSAFDWCDELSMEDRWPSELVKIGSEAFAHTASYHITLSDKVQSIGNSAFRSTKMKKLHISKSVNSIGYGAFCYDSYLEEIEVDVENPIFESRNCNGVIEKAENKMVLGCRKTSIPYDLLAIGKSAFNGIQGLKVEPYSLEYPVFYIPLSVEFIEAYSFINFEHLIIDCQAESKPAGWEHNWHNNNELVDIRFGVA